jgi:hypothetical protein
VTFRRLFAAKLARFFCFCPESSAQRTDGKVCLHKLPVCAYQPSSQAAASPPGNLAVQRPSVPSPSQHAAQLTSPTYVLDPVYFLEDSVFSLPSALWHTHSCLCPFPKNKKRPDLSERFSNFNFLSSNLYTFWIAGNSPLVFSSICSFRYTSELMSYVASSNPCPCVIASVGQASTQYPQKIHRE